jgi:rhodanese-related sulfurtransferase
MSKLWLAAFSVSTLLAGCDKHSATSNQAGSSRQGESATVPGGTAELSVTDVAALLKEKRVTAVDANGVETRQKYGVVPGAVLLSDHRSYALSELPGNKTEPLVFYCGGTQCRASDAAASRAISAGYAKVSVMRDGIRGWVSAGQPTTKS